MKNLTQIKHNPKQTELDSKTEKVFDQFTKAEPPERKAIIQQVSEFVQSAENENEKNFWQDLFRKLETK
ncbi:MAG: hypothetical protein LUM44_12565 [Pyrinomonadaceae bacterium]|nr:hypothetical protein [Pyrinomonadaceae bacterium]